VRFVMLSLAAVLALSGCGGGSYATGSGLMVDPSQRGETNGRSFDFESTKPNGASWTIRIRGTGMWVAYAKGEKDDDLGSFNLTGEQADKVWEMVDAVDIPNRREGKPDTEHGNVVLHLRDVEGKHHELYTIYVSRDTDDEDVLDLADYLATLVETYRKERPAF